MDRVELASLLNDLSIYMDLLGENPFKVRAHQNAARIIESFSGDLDEAVASGSIGKVKGIGPALKEKILEYHKTGRIGEYEKLKDQVPSGLLELLKIPGLGPKKVRVIHDKLKITSIGELEYACKENRLVNLEGFGEKTQAKILKNIEFLKKNQDSFLYSDAILEAQLMLAPLKNIKGVRQSAIAGSLRRCKEIVRDIDILIAADEASAVTKKFLAHPSVEKVVASGDTKTSVVLKGGLACDLRVVTDDEFPFALLYFTGSKEHNTAMRQIAKDKGLKLNEYGLFKGEKKIPCRSEAEIFEKLGLRYIEPEMRENTGEIEAAASNALPKLVEKDQIRGVFHCHTVESDGTNTLEEMVAAAQKLGFSYIGISDHSGTAVYANGLKKDRVLDQISRINALQKKFKIKIFKGIESDILPNGNLDYEESILKQFDFVIGSVHAANSMTEEQMTARVLKAMKNPYLDFLGHPTGRLLLAREPFPINMHEVIDEAAKSGVVVEMNANPQRLDMDWRLGQYLREKKARVSINPDAHSVAGLEDVEFGVGIARKAWLSAEFVVNTLPADKVIGALRRARNH